MLLLTLCRDHRVSNYFNKEFESNFMKCPYCENKDSKVVESRESSDSVRRRRECVICGLRFTTYETVSRKNIMVIKKDGHAEPFSQEKIEKSISLACAKRPIELGKISRIVVEIENFLQTQTKLEFESRIIGEIVINKLRDLDQVAYIRYVSVYKGFQNQDNFKNELESLENKSAEQNVNQNQLRLIGLDSSEINVKNKKSTKQYYK
tara:strand:- start:112 stop:732 length:621 start_codon:yes stop_codon:yes gene_type:complete